MNKLRFAYYPGCSAQGTASELNRATRSVCRELDIELVPIASQPCTGAREVRSVSDLAALSLNARILTDAADMRLPLMTVCNTCTLNLLEAHQRLTTVAQDRAAVSELLATEGITLNTDVRVVHFMWVLLDDLGLLALQDRVVNPLTNLALGAFYGCHLTRPPRVYGFIDSGGNDQMEALIHALGASSVDFSGRVDCCGFHTAAANETVAIKLTGRHLLDAEHKGANAIVTPCPLCHTVLDTLQPEMRRDLKQDVQMPILHLSQLVGLALGLGRTELGLARHVVSTKQVIWLAKQSAPIVKEHHD